MALAIRVEKHSNVSKLTPLHLKVVTEVKSRVEANTARTNAVHFLKDFEAVVHTEVQKSVDCIALIKQDIHHARTQAQQLRKQLHLESSANEKMRILNKIAVNKAWMAECEEHIMLINQRAWLLQEQLVLLQGQNINR